MSDDIDYQVKQAAIQPFWQKMPFFFMFPFRMGPLIMLVCLTLAAIVAGVGAGPYSLIFKGTLVYAGLRYAFNVLDLFSQGKFESESPEFTLMGSERRPAKFGLVVTLFLVLGTFLGNFAVISRVTTDKRVQAEFVERYKADHAAEMERARKDAEAFDKRYGLETSPASMPEPNVDDAQDDDSADATSLPPAAAMPTAPRAEPEINLAEVLAIYMPHQGEPRWFKLLPAWYWLIMIGLSALLPSALIVIAMEDKFFKALNPAHVIFLCKAMGKAYATLCVFVLVIAGTRIFALSAGAGLPGFVRSPLETALSTYLGIVLCALVGYALYQYHQELGLDVEVDFDSHHQAGGAEAIANAGSVPAALRKNLPEDPFERKIYLLLAEDKVAEAVEEIKDYMRYDRLNPDLNTRLHPLYAKLGDLAVVATHGQQWINALTRAERGAEALVALQKLQALLPDFTIENGDALLPIAQAAMNKREHALALKLIRGFDKRFPKHKDTAAIFFLGARLSSEYLRKHDDAIKILRAVLRAFPNDPIAPEAQTYLGVLEKIAPQSPV